MLSPHIYYHRGWQNADRLRSRYNLMLHNFPYPQHQHTRWCRNAYPPSPLCGSNICWSNCKHISSAKSNHNQLTASYSSSLRYACPHGVFMSLTPGDPTLWSGVIFVRKGPPFPPPSFPAPTNGFSRPIQPRSPPFPNLLSANLPLAPTSRNLQHRHLPPARHAFKYVHVHDRYPGLRDRVCY